MFTMISGNFLEDFGESYYFNIPGNIEEDSGECSTRFRGMFEVILGDVPRNSGKSSKRFRGIFDEIRGNV